MFRQVRQECEAGIGALILGVTCVFWLLTYVSKGAFRGSWTEGCRVLRQFAYCWGSQSIGTNNVCRAHALQWASVKQSTDKPLVLSWTKKEFQFQVVGILFLQNP